MLSIKYSTTTSSFIYLIIEIHLYIATNNTNFTKYSTLIRNYTLYKNLISYRSKY